MKSGIVPLKDIEEQVDFHELALGKDPNKIAHLRARALEGQIIIFRKAYDPRFLQRIKDYLSQICRSSLPNYVPIEGGCPNSHRVNLWDERSFVKACFHQFQFFPWNQDIFNLFEVFRPVFVLKNLLNDLPPHKFLSPTPEDGCVGRLAFQFYPSGGGGMNRHVDPLDKHQMIIPSLVMSQKGVDFESGGVFAEKADGTKVYLDALSSPGDIVFFNPQIIHGVQPIDPHTEIDWTSFKGRWMGLFAINKVSTNTQIENSKDLGAS